MIYLERNRKIVRVVEFLLDENFTIFTEQMNEIKLLIPYAMIWG